MLNSSLYIYIKMTLSERGMLNILNFSLLQIVHYYEKVMRVTFGDD